MATNVIMPQLGESVVEGTISRWLVQVGDTVEQYSPIMEVSTDKVDTEVPAPVAGVVLKLYHPEGATLQAGTVIAAIGQPGEAVADQPARVDLHAAGETAQAEPAAEAAPAAPARSAGRDLGRISPVVARIAQEHDVDLQPRTNCLPGSGLAAATCSNPPTTCRCPPARLRPHPRLRPLHGRQWRPPLQGLTSN